MSSLCSHPCTHSHPPILVLPHTSFHLILAKFYPSNSRNPHSNSPHSPYSSHTISPHHASITSSSHHHLNSQQTMPIASSHPTQHAPPIPTPPNPPNCLLKPFEAIKIPITKIDAPPTTPIHTKPIQSRRWDKPQGLAGQSQLIPSQYPLHTKSSTKDCQDNTISFNILQIVFLYPKRVKYSYVKYILSLYF